MTVNVKLGQYFTTNIELKNKVFEFILNKPDIILEPSIGRGDLIVFIMDKMPNIVFDMYEIDNTIKLLDGVNNNVNNLNLIYGDFMNQTITKKYKTIIGNPPYIRTKKGNLYIDFTEKCYNLLDDNGELIFIVPSDFLKLTSASKLLNTMMTNGTFTNIYHPHNEKMFANASIDIIIFRYCKNINIPKIVLYNDKLLTKKLYIINSSGLITFTEENMNMNINIITDALANVNINSSVLFQDYFNIYVGLVSGKEDIYKHEELGNIEVLNGENKLEKYIYIEKYPSDNEQINKHLLQHKNELISRKIRKFNENNWFEWGAPRNISAINNNIGKECIYIYNLTRKSSIAFVDNVKYFGGSLIMLIPKQKCDLTKIVLYINSDIFKQNFIFSGRFKIGHRQISNSYIPSNAL